MKPITGIIGIILLIASVVLVALSTDQQEQIAQKEAMVEKYVLHSHEALKAHKTDEAIKYAKLAITTDPKNKKGFKAYEHALKLKYKPSHHKDNDEGSTHRKHSKSTDEEEEEAPDMGC